jgi:hypothetical protein
MAGIYFLEPFFRYYALPFVLVFVLVYAVLQRTKLLGDDAKRVNSLIGMVVGLIVISFSAATNLIIQLMAFLAVVISILLVFLLIFGFIKGKTDPEILGKYWQYVLMGLFAAVMVIFLIVATGNWDWFINYITKDNTGRMLFLNGALVAIIVVALVSVLKGEKS